MYVYNGKVDTWDNEQSTAHTRLGQKFIQVSSPDPTPVDVTEMLRFGNCQCPWILKHMLLLSEDYQVVMASHCIYLLTPNLATKRENGREWECTATDIHWGIGSTHNEEKSEEIKESGSTEDKSF